MRRRGATLDLRRMKVNFPFQHSSTKLVEGTIDLQRFEPPPSQFVSAYLYCSLFSEDGLDGGVVLRARHSPRPTTALPAV